MLNAKNLLINEAVNARQHASHLVSTSEIKPRPRINLLNELGNFDLCGESNRQLERQRSLH